MQVRSIFVSILLGLCFLACNKTPDVSPTSVNTPTGNPGNTGSTAANSDMIYVLNREGSPFNLKAIDPKNGVVKWKYKVSGRLKDVPVILKNQSCYTVDFGEVSCFNLVTQKVIWQTDVVKSSTYSNTLLAVTDKVIYAISLDGVAMLDVQTGKIQQEKALDVLKNNLDLLLATITPLVYENTVLMAIKNKIIAIDGKNLTVLWTYVDIDSNNFSGIFQARNGVLFVKSANSFDPRGSGQIHAIDITTGKQRWKSEVPTFNSILSSPLSIDDKIYVSDSEGYSNSLYTLDANSGKKLAEIPINGITGELPVIDKGILFTRNKESALTAINSQTGTVLWQVKGAGVNSSSPTIVNSIAYVAVESNPGSIHLGLGDDYDLYAIDIAKPDKPVWICKKIEVADGPWYVAGTGNIYRGYDNVHP